VMKSRRFMGLPLLPNSERGKAITFGDGVCCASQQNWRPMSHWLVLLTISI
jgi:hypothetical protein